MANANQLTLFDLPLEPEQFSVALSPAELKRIDFSALEFPTIRRALISYIRIFFPNDFNDFVTHNGIIMLTELQSYVGSVLGLRSDILANESTLSTSKSQNAVINHLATIGQHIRAATPATADIECSVDVPVATNVHIPPGLEFNIKGDDGTSITYELFSSPMDLTADIIIPATKRGVIAFGLEGRTHTTTVISTGDADQIFTITDSNILEAPVKVNVTIDSLTEDWKQYQFIEKAKPTDKAFEVRFFDNTMDLVFGNDTTGAIPRVNATITITYRTGGGVRGRIGTGAINFQKSIAPLPPLTAPVIINFRNLNPSTGGTDRETIDQAKKRAPRDFATHDSATTADDYAQLAKSFAHPVFGAISKAVATIRTGFNANIVEYYVLAIGSNGEPVTASQGLKLTLATFITDLNVLSDGVKVLDGVLKPIDVQATVVMDRNADASVIKARVEAAVDSFFDPANFELGQPLYLAQLYKVINTIDGIVYVDIFKPVDNILPTKLLSGAAIGVGINELIVLGDKEITYYYSS